MKNKRNGKLCESKFDEKQNVINKEVSQRDRAQSTVVPMIHLRSLQ